METTHGRDVGTIKDMTDDQLIDELRLLVNEARNTQKYNRVWAQALGKECQDRGIIKPKKV